MVPKFSEFTELCMLILLSAVVDSIALIFVFVFAVSAIFGGKFNQKIPIFIPEDGNSVIFQEESFELNDYEIGEGYNGSVFDLICNSPNLSSVSVSTIGVGHTTSIDISRCDDLTNFGAKYQMIEASVDIELGCKDCMIYEILREKEKRSNYFYTDGIIWVQITGPNPELVIISK